MGRRETRCRVGGQRFDVASGRAASSSFDYATLTGEPPTGAARNLGQLRARCLEPVGRRALAVVVLTLACRRDRHLGDRLSSDSASQCGRQRAGLRVDADGSYRGRAHLGGTSTRRQGAPTDSRGARRRTLNDKGRFRASVPLWRGSFAKALPLSPPTRCESSIGVKRTRRTTCVRRAPRIMMRGSWLPDSAGQDR